MENACVATTIISDRSASLVCSSGHARRDMFLLIAFEIPNAHGATIREPFWNDALRRSPFLPAIGAPVASTHSMHVKLNHEYVRVNGACASGGGRWFASTLLLILAMDSFVVRWGESSDIQEDLARPRNRFEEKVFSFGQIMWALGDLLQHGPYLVNRLTNRRQTLHRQHLW